MTNIERAINILISLGLPDMPALARELAIELDAAEQRERERCARMCDEQARHFRRIIDEYSFSEETREQFQLIAIRMEGQAAAILRGCMTRQAINLLLLCGALACAAGVVVSEGLAVPERRQPPWYDARY